MTRGFWLLLLLLMLALAAWAFPGLEAEVIRRESLGLIDLAGLPRAKAIGLSADNTTRALLNAASDPAEPLNGFMKALRQLLLRAEVLLFFAPVTGWLGLGLVIEALSQKLRLAQPALWRPSFRYQRVHRRTRWLQGLILLCLLGPVPLPPSLLLGLMVLLLQSLSDLWTEDRLSDPIVS